MHGDSPGYVWQRITAPSSTGTFSSNTDKKLATENKSDYAYMFPVLAADSVATLPRNAEMPRRLFALASVMTEEHQTELVSDSEIPAVYTYFGQFIDHDISFQFRSPLVDELSLSSSQPLVDASSLLKNERDPLLNFCLLYTSPSPRDRTRSRMPSSA